ncbi:MAG TPA: UdgX family uracil-DNA binding protein [Solirubrobacterales bacterium]|nr:UdgX family uracil-DNA binding protein [Solirubrobacterales bacterium]
MTPRTAESAAEYLPSSRDLEALRTAAAACRGCPLYAEATQTVFGGGGEAARLMLVGEQPGDREDRAGEPFVGPAGRILDQALEEAGIRRDLAYVTNAVKHFKWRPRGTRRIHVTPRVGEIEACKPWLEAEVDAVRPEAIVAMGATAARAVFGPGVKVTKDRGRTLDTPLAPIGAVTLHPSAVLRVREKAEREDALAALVADLAAVDRALRR